MKFFSAKSITNGTHTQRKSLSDELTLYQKISLYHARALSLSMALVISPLNAIFWQRLTARTMLTMLSELNISKSDALDIAIQTTASIFATAKFLADESSVNPLALADNYIYLKRPTNHYKRLARWLALLSRLISLGFVYSTISVMPTLVFSELTARDHSLLKGRLINITNLSIFLLYGLDFSWIFHKEPLEQNFNASLPLFSHAAKNIKSAMINADKILELLLTTTLRSSQSALMVAFLAFEANRHIFEIQPSHFAIKSYAYTAATFTFLLSFHTLLLKNSAKFFNKAFSLLNTDNVIIYNTPLILKHCLPAVIRAASASLFTLDLLSQRIKNHWLLAGIGLAEFGLLWTQSLSINYKMATLEEALARQQFANSIIEDKIPLTASTLVSTESSSLIASSSTYSLSSETNASSIDRSQAFAELANLPHFKPGLTMRNYATIISIAAKLLLCICTYYIIYTINDIIELGLHPVGVAALSVLLSSTDFMSDVSNNASIMCNSQTNQNVAYAIETNKVGTENQHGFFKPFNYIKNKAKAWLVSPVHYSMDEINAARPR